MNKFWATMLIENKATIEDIKSESRKNAVKKLLEQYVEEGIITQDTYNMIFHINPNISPTD